MIGANRRRIASELARLVEQPRYVLTTDAVVHRDFHALAAEVIDDCPKHLRRPLAKESITKSMLSTLDSLR